MNRAIPMTCGMAFVSSLALGMTGCATAKGGCNPHIAGNASMSFDAKHVLTVKIPEGARNARIWFVVPRNDDPYQTVSDLKVNASAPHTFSSDNEGNTYLYFDLNQPKAGDFTVETSFMVERREANFDVNPARSGALTAYDLAGKEKYLAANKEVIIDDRIMAKTREVVGDDRNVMSASRKLYDWVLGHVQYWVKDPAKLKASGRGSTDYTLTQCTGNCTDFHALYVSMSRAAGIPTRIVYGSFFKGPLKGQDKDQSYHCWVEFFDPVQGWVPLDVAVGDCFVNDFTINDDNREKVSLTLADGYHGADKGLVNYYFGNIDNRRVSWTVGRDIVLSPKQSGSPVNHLPKAHVEIDGKEMPEKAENWSRKLTFTER